MAPRSLSLAVTVVTLLIVLFFTSSSCPAASPPLRVPVAATALCSAGAAALPVPAAPPACFPANPTTCEGVCLELLDKIRQERAKSTWSQYYGDVAAELFRRGVSEGVVVEVGTAYGGLARHLLSTHPKLRVIAVDPFFGDYDGADSMSTFFRGMREQYGQSQFSALWARALAFEGGQDFGCRYSVYNEFSEAAARHFPPRSLDAIFIDGDHTQAGVEKDIAVWAPVVKVGRALLFNDYQEDRWPGVVKAVNDLAERTAQPVYYLPQRSWGNVMLFNLPELFTVPKD